MRRHLALIASAALVLASAGLAVPTAQAATTVVPDPQFAACLNQLFYLDQNPDADISASQLEGLTQVVVNCSGYGISSLEGAQYLTNVTQLQVEMNHISDITPVIGLHNLEYLYLSDNQISSLPDLSAMTSLYVLYLAGNQLTDITGLAGLTNLSYLGLNDNQISGLPDLSAMTSLSHLDLSGNQMTGITGLAGLTGIDFLDLSNNQVSDVSPLANLTDLSTLFLHNNQIADISPLAPLINAGCTVPASQAYCAEILWTLNSNRIADLSSLDWSVVGRAWSTVPSEYDSDTPNYAVNAQTLATTTATSGTTVPLPIVATASGSPYPVTWSVTSGHASIDPVAGTVSYATAGAVMLHWSDGFTATCAESYSTDGSAPCSPGNTTPIQVSFFSGNVSVNVSDSTTPPTPSAPDSDAAIAPGQIIAATTGGTARLADGADAFSIVTTVRDAAGSALTGFGSDLTATASSPQVTISALTDNGDGTYSIAVTSTKPGDYTITLALDGTTLGAPIPVNFIAATVTTPSLPAGASQSATGLGFQPGEAVSVTVHSTPLNLGTKLADAHGTVAVSFAVPGDFDLGRHTVVFTGAVSGSVTVGFDVIGAPAPGAGGGSGAHANTGGTVAPGSVPGLPQAALVLLLGLAGLVALIYGRRSTSR